eukprot:1077270-Prymnesium_polylepis.2
MRVKQSAARRANVPLGAPTPNWPGRWSVVAIASRSKVPIVSGTARWRYNKAERSWQHAQ